MTDAGPVMLPDLDRMRAQRLARLRDQMRANNIAGAILLHGPNVSYATGFVPEAVDATHANHHRAVAIVGADDGPTRLHTHPANLQNTPRIPQPANDKQARLHTHPNEHQIPKPADDGPTRLHTHSAVGLYDIEEVDPLWPELDDGIPALRASIAEVLGDVAGLRIAVDAMTGAMWRAGLLDRAELVDASRVMGPARLVKTEDELACIDIAQRRTEQAMEAAQAACVPHASRCEVAAAFLSSMLELDARQGWTGQSWIDPVFQPMPSRRDSGPRTSTGHVAFPTGVDNHIFTEGDLVWVDAGADYQGYLSDFGRTWVVGRHPTAAERDLFGRWSAVLDASLSALRPGATLGDVGRAAQAAEAGAEAPWLPHFYLAHGVGLESAEMPMMGTDLGSDFDDRFVIEPGMVLVFEPVVWADGVGGYRAEEIVAVTNDGWRPIGGGHHYHPFKS